MLHPIVAQMEPSPEQQPAVTARGRDVVVTAGAGTGKTRTLVARYLSLLAELPEGVSLRSVVAITFTKKAAREMRNRVRDEIRRYLERPDLDEAERQRWQRLYSELDAARISTIHGLCTEILQAHPAEAGVDPRFDVLDEGQASLLSSQALDSALAWAAEDSGAVKLFSLLGEGELRRALETLLQQRLDAEGSFESLPDPLWPHWEAHVSDRLRGFVDDRRVRAGFEDLLALRDDGTLDRAEAKGDLLAAPLRQVLALWSQILSDRETGDWVGIAGALSALRDNLKQKGRAANWHPAKPKPIIADLQARYDDLLGSWMGSGIDLALDRRLAEAMPWLKRAFEQAAGVYRQLKATRQALDFDDQEAGALRLLRHEPGVRDRWQAEVRAILVDEFQDTNGRQRDLVKLLNGDAGRLFIVGDAKQSIYRFRGADVTVFRGEREAVGEAGGVVLSLDRSYRAHRDLVRGLNDLLRPVLGEEADPARPWAEPFAPLEHHRQEPSTGFRPPHIELHLAVGSKSDGALDRAADALVGRIVALVEGDGSHAVDFGDVAILCRASGSFAAYEDALDRAGVPFLTVAGRGFYGRPEIRDLLNALRALDDPTDDLALFGLLRSPAFALTDDALYRLCCRRDETQPKPSLWEVLRGGDHGLVGDDGARAGRAARIVADLHARAGRVSTADLLKAFLDATDYRAALLCAGQARAARNVSKLLADAHTGGIVSVGEFLAYVDGLRDSGTREGEARATAEGAVQIMSVHAAKGLEFPVVVIGDAGYGGGGRGGLLIDPELGVLFPLKNQDGALPAVYRLGKLLSDDQEEAELDRLLYVAATRAREKLIFSGCIRLNKDNRVGKQGGWLNEALGPGGLGLVGETIEYDPAGAQARDLALRVGETPVACTLYEPAYDPGLSRLGRPAEGAPEVTLPPPLLAPVAAEPMAVDAKTVEQDRIPAQRVWRVVPAVKDPRVPAWVLGSLVHEALAAWRFPGDEFGEEPDFERWARARARGYGVTDPHQLRDAVGQTRQLLLRFQNHPLFADMDGADRRLHEVPYSLVTGGRVENGSLDALFLANGQWSIVEFKTDRIKDEKDFAEKLEQKDYLAQMQRYVAAAQRLLSQRPRAILCWLNYQRSVRLYQALENGGWELLP